MEYSLMQADKDLFSIYQTIYSNADIEMWFDWKKRLDDTKWTDQCYFVLLDGQKIGGIIITDDTIMFPFIIPPYCDRTAFWTFVLKHSGRERIKGVLDIDSVILPMFGYKIDTVNQVMCRPVDCITHNLPDSFICRTVNINTEAKEIGNVIIQSYAGGICDEINGAASLEEAIEDAKRVLDVYSHKD